MKKVYKIILIIIAIIIVYFLLKSKVTMEVIKLIFISFLVAYVLKPFVYKLMDFNISKRISSLIVILLTILIVVLFFMFLIPTIFSESSNMTGVIGKIQLIIDNLYERLKFLHNNRMLSTITDSVSSNINAQMDNLLTKMSNGILDFGENLMSIAVVPIIAYYFLSDSDIIIKRILMIIPINNRDIVRRTIENIDKILSKYILSQLILSLIIGVFTFIILVILRINFPLMLSIFNAILNIIPYFGPIFGAIPAILVAFLQSPKTAIWTAVWLYVLQQIEGNIISPKLTGLCVKMHPLLVIILLIVGGEISGFIGMVLAIPVGVVIKIIYDDLNYYLF